MRWDSILGQDAPVRFLRRALSTGRLPHVLLFWGPRGVGKRATATALAASALCESPLGGGGGGDEACGACGSCRELASGVHPDFHEIMAVEKRDGKEAVRELTDEDRTITIASVRRLVAEMSLTAARGGRKVALVPLASRIQEISQNALLKTLEEPSGDSLWILTAEDPSLILPTVRSRATPVRFGRVPTGVIQAAIAQDSADAGGETAFQRAAPPARAAEGSFARAREMLSEEWREERAFLAEHILPQIGAGPQAGSAVARAFRERVSAPGRAKKKRKKSANKSAKKSVKKGAGKGPKATAESGRRPALRLLAALELLLREKMREAARAGTDGGATSPSAWARRLEAVLEADAAIRQNVRVELILAVAAARLSRR